MMDTCDSIAMESVRRPVLLAVPRLGREGLGVGKARLSAGKPTDGEA